MANALGDAISAGMEEAMGSFQLGGSEEEIAREAEAFDELHPVSAKDLESAWRVLKDYRGSSSLDAIAELAATMELAVYPAGHADALAAEVTFDTRGMSKLEAIEKIAEARDLQPAFPDLTDYGVMQALVEGLGDVVAGLVTGDDPLITVQGGEAEAEFNKAKAEIENLKSAPKNAIRFEARDPDRRVVFAGPFHVRVASLEENPPHATGSLIVVAAAYGLPESVVITTGESNDGMQLSAVEDAKGRALIDMDVTYFGGGQPAGTAYVDTATRDLKNLLRDVESVERISGEVSLLRPAELLDFDFTSLTPNTSIAKGDFRFTISQVTDQNISFKVGVPEGWEGDLTAKMQPYKADGSPMGVTFSDVSYWGNGQGNANLNTPETPARVRIKLIPKVETKTYAFELGPVALQHYAEMPEKLEELRFAGHDAPVSFSFVKVVEPDDQFAKVLLKIENHSNKAPQSAFVDFIYRDASGNEIDSFPHTVTGDFSSDGWDPLVEPGATAESEQTAFQMPANTKSIDFVVNSLEFLDGTKWQPEN
jgi:hypothetical protein